MKDTDYEKVIEPLIITTIASSSFIMLAGVTLMGIGCLFPPLAPLAITGVILLGIGFITPFTFKFLAEIIKITTSIKNTDIKEKGEDISHNVEESSYEKVNKNKVNKVENRQKSENEENKKSEKFKEEKVNKEAPISFKYIVKNFIFGKTETKENKNEKVSNSYGHNNL